MKIQDAPERTARGAVQNTFAGAVVTLGLYFLMKDHGDGLPVAVLLAINLVIAAVFSFVQNVWENTVGKAFLKRVPEEPLASEGARVIGA